jgi:hypothetical protein
MKKVIRIEGEILPGCISTASATCGTAGCACRAKPPKLHGPYYRWTGFIDGKRTTRTISKEQAAECELRIQNYKHLREQIDQLCAEALKSAPWVVTQK